MKFAHPGPEHIPNRRRCKVRHSPGMPARCKLARGHEGDCRFGWWPPAGYGGQRVDLDAPAPKVVYRSSIEPEDT